jgi:hypothetical protein
VRYVVLTDGNVPYNLYYIKSSDGTYVSTEVLFGKDRKTSTEQSSVVSGLRTVVVNNYFADKQMPSKFDSFCSPPWFFEVCSATLLYSFGVAAYDLDPETMTISKAWERTDISCSSGIPVVSSPKYKPQVLYCIGIKPNYNSSLASGVGMTTLEAINWETGESFFQYKLGRSPLLSVTWAATTIHESGIFYGGLGGVVHIYNESSAERDSITCEDSIGKSSICNSGGICTCEDLLSNHHCSSKVNITGVPYTPVNRLCGGSCQLCNRAPNKGTCTSVIDGNLCDGIYLTNSRCSCEEGVSGTLCSGGLNLPLLLTSGRQLPFDTCFHDGLFYRKIKCTDDIDFIALFTYSDPLCAYDYSEVHPFSMRKDKCYDFSGKYDVTVTFNNTFSNGHCVRLSDVDELKVPDSKPTFVPMECNDTAEYSDICRYSSKYCTCSELLESATCGIPFTTTVTFAHNTDSCDLEMLVNDIRELADRIGEPMVTNCEKVYGSWPMPQTCTCFANIPEEDASVILNCYYGKVYALAIWKRCTNRKFTLTQRSITSRPAQICPTSCGLCAEPIACNDTAEYSDICRYSSKYCTCSELLESATCGLPFTTTLKFVPNTDSCDLELLINDIRDIAHGVGEPMVTNCEKVYGSWPMPETCTCLKYIPEEDASVILNCYYYKTPAYAIWERCTRQKFNLTQRSITFNPAQICPTSCGKCAEPIECNDIADYSEICRYSSKYCTCSELLETATCGVPFTTTLTFALNTNSCDLDMLVNDIRELADRVGEPMVTNCEKVYGSWQMPETCTCFKYIPEVDASVILNCYYYKMPAWAIWERCTSQKFTLIQRSITSNPDRICPTSCGLCETESSECEDILEWGDEYDTSLCPKGFTGMQSGPPVICDYWERLQSGFYKLTSTIYQERLKKSIANGLFSSCTATCVYDIDTIANISYNWLGWKGCWKKVTEGVCFDAHAKQQFEAKERITNVLCVQATVPPDLGCTERVLVWNETVAEQTCNLEYGRTDKSASATVCKGYEHLQHNLELSLANRMFLSCKAWCVYSIYERAYEAFVWRTSGCWAPSRTCVSKFKEEREVMTDYVDNVLCESNTTDCEVELGYSENLMNELCTVSATGRTYKHYDTREPVACSGDLADTSDLKKSLANGLFDNCGAWCVFDWKTQAFNAWLWEPSGKCWNRNSDGFCFYHPGTNIPKQMWTEARALIASKCDFDASFLCYKEYEWTEDRANQLCTATRYGPANKSYSGAVTCSGEGGRETQLKKSLANKLYTSCSSWCIYDWYTLMDDKNALGGYMWNHKDDCYRWITDGVCFKRFSSEHQAARKYVLETCSYLDI